MPTWGLTKEMRREQPWGLPEDLLKPAKTQTDPVHGDIHWTELEALVIDSPAVQRLRHVKQLGTTLKVYPAAEHSRFTHLLGTMAAAQAILDRLLDNHNGPQATPSLLDEWDDDDEFQMRWAEATVLARLASLLHDLTHVPFGHTIEDDLSILTPHDENVERFDACWAELPEHVRNHLEQATSAAPKDDRENGLFASLRRIVLDKGEPASLAGAAGEGDEEELKPLLYPFIADVVNNTICADLLDYIARDHLLLGLPFAVGDRFMNNFYIVPSYDKSDYKERLVVNLVRDGEVRQDVRTELLKILRFRYEATERALYHKTKLAYDAMLGKMLEMWKDAMWRDAVLEQLPELEDDPRSLDASWLRTTVREDADEFVSEEELDARVRAEVEKHFRFFGDEGLIEHIIWQLQEETDELDERQAGILELAERIRYRSHYKLLGQASGPAALGVADEKYRNFGTANQRRDLERYAAGIAGVSPAWRVVLWIPSPTMRLKIAEVLITEHDNVIRKLAHASPTGADRAAGDPDAAAIVDRHLQLWSLRVYGDPEIRHGDQCNRLLGTIQHELGLQFVRWDGEQVPTVAAQVAEELRDERNWNREKTADIRRSLEDKAAQGPFNSWEELRAVADSLDEE